MEERKEEAATNLNQSKGGARLKFQLGFGFGGRESGREKGSRRVGF